MNNAVNLARKGLDAIDQWGWWIGQLSLRLLLAWEFGEAGLEKLNGSNWFVDIQDRLPWPFRLVPADINWTLAMGFETVGAIAMLLPLVFMGPGRLSVEHLFIRWRAKSSA
jgi:putative oxidoreductase